MSLPLPGAFLSNLMMAFITLFVAIDPIGLTPVAEGFFAGLDDKKRRRILFHGLAAAFIVGIGFLFLGEAILGYLGIGVGDFKVAGGILLFALALKDMVTSEKNSVDPEELGAVPLGVPLIVGPGAVTSLIVLSAHYGFMATLVAFVTNLIVVGVMLWLSKALARLLGGEGAKVLSKVANFLLAAFAVLMIRLGILDIIASARG